MADKPDDIEQLWISLDQMDAANKQDLVSLVATKEFIEDIHWPTLRTNMDYLERVAEFYKLTSGEGRAQEEQVLNIMIALEELAIKHFGIAPKCQ